MQDTVADMAKDMRKNKTGAAQASAAELYDFMKKVITNRACASHASRVSAQRCAVPVHRGLILLI